MPEPTVNGAKHGEKMIEVRLRFWTNDIADDDGKIVAKHGWDKGTVTVSANSSHGLAAGKPLNFNSIL